MLYELKNCRDASPATYHTTVDITEKDGILNFVFTAKHSSCYCPFDGYNELHSSGDACEILIGSDPNRKFYYEIEISPKNDLMIALMEYQGEGPDEPLLGMDFQEDCFVKSTVTKIENGYIANLSFPKERIMSGDGEIFFNAYRLDTDGEETDRHLFALNPTMRAKFHTPEYYVYLKDYCEKL